MKRTSCFFQPYAVFLMVLLTAACTPKRLLSVMDSADSLMDARPDSALTLLNTLLPDTNTMSKRDLMRFHLLRTNAENKCDTVLTARHAALMRRVCDYYDRKSPSPFGEGSGVRLSNSRMLAHYLLGRCYSDMGEAPAALREFTIAEDQADTTNIKCDFILLSNLCYQNARLFSYQMLLPDALKYYDYAEHYAYKGGDTLRAVSCFEHEAVIYTMMNEPDSVLWVCEKSMNLYKQHGYEAESYNCIPLLAKVLIDLGKTDQVGRLLADYEKYSGLFGPNGEIAAGREIYYYFKGEYLMTCSRFDEARECFERLLSFSHDNNNVEAAAKGLLNLYQRLHEADSISKYAQLYCNANDSSYSHIYLDEMIKSKAMFDYSRMERIAADKSLEASKNKNAIFMLITIISLLVSVFIMMMVWLWNFNKKRKLNHALLNGRYNALLLELAALENQLNTSNDKYQTMLNKYQRSQKQLYDANVKNKIENDTLNKRIKELGLQLSEIMKQSTQEDVQWDSSNSLLHYSIVRRFHEKATRLEVPTEREWKDLEATVSYRLQPFYQFISSQENKLTILEMRLALLIRLNFIVSECCILLDKRSQSITNLRAKINKKLFNAKGTRNLDSDIMSM